MRGRGDAGVTLIELLVVVIMLPLVTGTVALAFVTWLRTTDGTQERLSESNAAALVAHYFTPDVQRSLDLDPVDEVCGDGPDPVLTTRWWSEGGTRYSSWRHVEVGDEWHLTRTVCAGDTPQATNTVARDVASVAVECGRLAGSVEPCDEDSRWARIDVTEGGFAFSVWATRRTTPI